MLTASRVGDPPLDIVSTMARGNFSVPENITCGGGKIRPGTAPPACTCGLKAGMVGHLRLYAAVA
jgi:hypothetical protein